MIGKNVERINISRMVKQMHSGDCIWSWMAGNRKNGLSESDGKECKYDWRKKKWMTSFQEEGMVEGLTRKNATMMRCYTEHLLQLRNSRIDIFGWKKFALIKVSWACMMPTRAFIFMHVTHSTLNGKKNNKNYIYIYARACMCV